MTVTTTFQVEFVDASGTTDLTSDVMGFQILQRVSVGTMASYTGSITLDNTDNKFTPGAGGTYASFAWFSKVIKISCDVNDGSTTGTAEVAHMVVNDIRFDDDGSYSRVSLRLVDPFIYTGRDAVEAIDVAIAYGYLYDVSQNLINGAGAFGGITAVTFPKFGATNATVCSINTTTVEPPESTAFTSNTAPGYGGIIDEFESGTAKDHINQQILPSGPAIIYPTTADYSGGDAKWTLNAQYVNRLLTKGEVSSTEHYRLFEFTETDTADKQVFQDVSVQFNSVDVVNEAQIQVVYPVGSEGPNTSQNATSQSTVGIRAITYDKLITFNFGGATQADKAFIGDFWVNRYGEIDFTPQQLTTHLEGMNPNIDSSSRQTYIDFLDCRTGIWNPAKITFTPTGAGSSQTHLSVITGRAINATPDKTTITVFFKDGVDNQSLELDETNIGILDTNRIG